MKIIDESNIKTFIVEHNGEEYTIRFDNDSIGIEILNENGKPVLDEKLSNQLIDFVNGESD